MIVLHYTEALFYNDLFLSFAQNWTNKHTSKFLFDIGQKTQIAARSETKTRQIFDISPLILVEKQFIRLVPLNRLSIADASLMDDGGYVAVGNHFFTVEYNSTEFLLLFATEHSDWLCIP